MPQPPKTSADAILDHALPLLERDGPAALTMRALASGLGVTPNALYWHFPDRGALLAALAQRGETELLRDLQATPGAHGTRAHLEAVARAYLHFARTRPHLYALSTAPRPDKTHDATNDLWPFVTNLLTPLCGPLAPQAAVALWAYLHGAVSLDAAAPYADDKPEGGVLLGLRALLRGLEQESP